MPWMIGVGAAAGLAGGIGGLISSNNSNAAAQQATQQAVQQYLNATIPDPAEQAVALQQYQVTGQMDPRLEQAISMSQNALNDVHANPALQGAQMNALDQLQQEGLQGGLTLQDQATLQQQENNTAAQARGQIGAIQNQMQAQGLGGSGLGLQAQLQAAQNQNQTNAQNSLQAAADARSRALQAVGQSGQLANQMQGQQYQQQNTAAQAQNAINQFNTINSQNVSNQNTALANQAQQYNLNLGQQVANANTNLSNQQQMYNKGLIQQQYENQMQKAGGIAGAYQNQANADLNAGKQSAASWAGMGNGLNQAANAYGQYSMQNPSGGSGGSGSLSSQIGNYQIPGGTGNPSYGNGNQYSLLGDDQNSLSTERGFYGG